MGTMRWIPVLLLIAALTACSNDGGTAPETDPALWTEVDPEGGFITVVEAGDLYSEKVIYFSFEDGGERFPLNPDDSTDWDLSFRFAWIQTNGGVSGSGEVAVQPVDFAEYLTFDRAPGGDYFADTDELLAFDIGQGWYRYIQGIDEWFINDRVYAIRALDGRYFKLQVINFLDESGAPGLLEFRWAEISPPS